MNGSGSNGGRGDAPSDDNAKLPHDRDEATGRDKGNAQQEANRDQIDQARTDVESGQQDTERYGIPSDVPSSTENRK